jgi:hypothetical protein
VIQQ